MVHEKTYEPITCNVCGITLQHKFSYGSHFRNKHKQFFNIMKEQTLQMK